MSDIVQIQVQETPVHIIASTFVPVAGGAGGFGPTGATGPQGAAGPTGATGIQGPAGAVGQTGATGVQGIQGPQGATGIQGPVGVTGVQGPVGQTGATGIQGAVGQTGATGIQGPVGQTGPQGVTGVTGPAGTTLYSGLTGVPVGILSSSAQFNALTNTSASYAAQAGNAQTAVSASWAPGVGGGTTWDAVSSKPVGLVSSSAQAAAWTVATASVALNAPTLPTGLVSSSAQVSYTGITGVPVGIVSSSTQVDYTGIINKPVGLLSSSVQVNAILDADGVVSSSAQVSYTGLSNIPVGILSSSAQVNTILDADGVISSSAQVQFLSISNRPVGLVSSSAQVSYTGISGVPTGIVSSSGQIATWTAASASVATSASYALTASYALNGGGGGGGPVDTAATASYISGTAWTDGGSYSQAIVDIVSASFAQNALTANSVESSSYAVTSSYVQADRITLRTRFTPPTDTTTGGADLYVRSFGGRLLPSMIGPSRLPTPLQTGLYNNNIMWLTTQATTTVGAVGNTATNIGTVSHPAATERYGRMVNVQTGAGTIGTIVSASSAMTDAAVIRGTSVTGSGGFFMSARMAFPDTNYSNPTIDSGSRVFVGLSSATMNGVAANPSTSLAHAVGFQLQIPTGDVSWSIVTRDGTNLTRQNTGVGFAPESIYDFYLFCPPSGTQIGWRVDNVLTGQVNEGIISGTLPGATTYLRAGFDTNSRTGGTARNFRFQRIYLESDR